MNLIGIASHEPAQNSLYLFGSEGVKGGRGGGGAGTSGNVSGKVQLQKNIPN